MNEKLTVSNEVWVQEPSSGLGLVRGGVDVVSTDIVLLLRRRRLDPANVGRQRWRVVVAVGGQRGVIARVAGGA